MNDDNSRKCGLMQCLGKGEFSRFSIGNQQTLNHQYIQQDLRDFFNRYYSANLMMAVVLSKLTFSEMEAKALSLFESIPNKNIERPKFQDPFPADRLNRLVKMQSIKEEFIMEFRWHVGALKPYFRKHI